MGKDHLALDGHDLFESVEGHVAPFSLREVMEEGCEHLIKDAGAWKDGGERETGGRREGVAARINYLLS